MVFQTNGCTAPVTLTLEAEDICSDDLNYEFWIDWNDDGDSRCSVELVALSLTQLLKWAGTEFSGQLKTVVVMFLNVTMRSM